MSVYDTIKEYMENIKYIMVTDEDIKNKIESEVNK